MAKISEYPVDGSVSLSDMLIGTDAEDLNKTKNFTLWSVLALFSSEIQDSYVPYSGATGNVDLGGNDLLCHYFTASNGILSNEDIVSYTKIYAVEFIASGLIVGSALSVTNGVDLGAGALIANALAGNAGQVLQSQGAGASPQWADPSTSIPYASFYHSVDQIGVPGDVIIVNFNTARYTNPNIAIASGTGGPQSQIQFVTDGSYRIDVSLQVSKTAGVAQSCMAWLRKNGSDIASSATSFLFDSGASFDNKVISFIADGVSTDYVEVVLFTTGDIDLVAVPSSVGPPAIPAVPSASVIITKL